MNLSKRKAFLLILIFSLGLISLIYFLFPKTEVTKTSIDQVLVNFASNKREPRFLKGFSQIKKNLIESEIDFLEVNLAQMKIRLYKKGVVEKEAPVLLKGDPQKWGGTPGGLYQIKDKYKSSFSVVSKVYMPYALHIEGKYYIHGEPYYPGGVKLNSVASGGCIRLTNEDAKVIFNNIEKGTLTLVINQEETASDFETKKPPSVSAESYLVADLESGFVFAEKKAREQFPIASITKLMTATVITENIDLRKSILINKRMLEPYGSTEILEQGKSFRVVELLYPLLVESSNDAAEALSYFLGKEKTIQLMNQKAKSFLMPNTKFVDPSGFDPDSVSTAQDLFYLARHIFYSRPPLLKITKAEKVNTFGEVSFNIEKLWNKNIFVYDPTFVGGKSGYTKQANHTGLFIFQFIRDNEKSNIVFILLNSENEKRDTQKLYIWLQNRYFQN